MCSFSINVKTGPEATEACCAGWEAMPARWLTQFATRDEFLWIDTAPMCLPSFSGSRWCNSLCRCRCSLQGRQTIDHGERISLINKDENTANGFSRHEKPFFPIWHRSRRNHTFYNPWWIAERSEIGRNERRWKELFLAFNPFNCHPKKAKVPIIFAAQTLLRNDSYFVASARTSFECSKKKERSRQK